MSKSLTSVKNVSSTYRTPQVVISETLANTNMLVSRVTDLVQKLIGVDLSVTTALKYEVNQEESILRSLLHEAKLANENINIALAEIDRIEDLLGCISF